MNTPGFVSTANIPLTFATLTGSQSLSNKTLVSPAITGTPTAPTASVGTNNTQLATTAFVLANIPTTYLDMGQYSGDGLSTNTKLVISNLSGAVITSGAIADARLTSNVPLKGGTNVFTGANTFGDITVQNMTIAGGILSNNDPSQYALYSGNGAKLRVGIAEFLGYLELLGTNAGIYMKSPNGTRYKFGVSDAGAATFTPAP